MGLSTVRGSRCLPRGSLAHAACSKHTCRGWSLETCIDYRGTSPIEKRPLPEDPLTILGIGLQ